MDWELDWSENAPETYRVASKHSLSKIEMKPHTVEFIGLASHGPYFVYDFSASLIITSCADAIEIDRSKAPEYVRDSGY